MHEIQLKYYKHTNEHTISEYYNYILNLFRNHKFGFPIKTTIFTENLLYNIKDIDNDNEIDVTNITNYQNYFDTNTVKVKDIYKVILKFFGYYNDKRIEMVNIYNTIQDISNELNIEFDNRVKNKIFFRVKTKYFISRQIKSYLYKDDNIKHMFLLGYTCCSYMSLHMQEWAKAHSHTMYSRSGQQSKSHRPPSNP